MENKSGGGRRIKKFLIVLIVNCLLNLIFIGIAQASTQITAPPSGWTRYDDLNSLFLYSSNVTSLSLPSQAVGNEVKVIPYNNSATFCFYGTGFEVIGIDDPNNQSSNISVTLDGTNTGSFSQRISPWQDFTMCYQNVGLSLGRHVVVLTNKDNTHNPGNLIFDAVDIDAGYLESLTPNVPTGLLSSNITNTSFVVNWDYDQGASSYNIYMDNKLQGNVNQPTSGNPSFNINGLAAGSSHTINIQAVNPYGTSALSQTLNVTTNQPPQAPLGLSVGNITQTSFTIYWSKQSDADSYNVYMDGTILGNVSQPIIYNPSYNVTGLGVGTTHTITITAINQYGESSPSQPLNVTTTIPTPVLESSIDGTKINLTWVGITGSDTYNVMVNGSQITSTTGTQYTYTGQPGKTYQLQVIENNNSNQIPSNTVYATISAMQTVGGSQMAGDLMTDVGLVIFPIGGLLAMALGIKGSPWLITVAKSLLQR
jgi:hypothetical protein